MPLSLRKIGKKVKVASRKLFPLRVFDYYPDTATKPRGDVLVSYLPGPLTWKASDKRFLGYSHTWESAEIVRIFNRLGFKADVISWDDTSFVPRKKYDVVFDIHQNLAQYSGDATCKILHITTSYPEFSNLVERDRLEQLRKRRGADVDPLRYFTDTEIRLFKENLKIADVITLIGNDASRETFPEEFRTKIVTLNATGSVLSNIRELTYGIRGREFLWFNGVGALHKGLDLVLDVFATHPEWVLHIVGPYAKERDFVRVYRRELKGCANIKSHGFLYPSSREFQKVVENVIAFINPTCSEGMSTSAITCLQYGMIPIISHRSGLPLPDDLGVSLQKCSHEEIEMAITRIINKSDDELLLMIARSQDYALKAFSREQFTSRMHSIICVAVDAETI